jgi:hypothetical protein
MRSDIEIFGFLEAVGITGFYSTGAPRVFLDALAAAREERVVFALFPLSDDFPRDF